MDRITAIVCKFLGVVAFVAGGLTPQVKATEGRSSEVFGPSDGLLNGEDSSGSDFVEEDGDGEFLRLRVALQGVSFNPDDCLKKDYQASVGIIAASNSAQTVLLKQGDLFFDGMEGPLSKISLSNPFLRKAILGALSQRAELNEPLRGTLMLALPPENISSEVCNSENFPYRVWINLVGVKDGGITFVESWNSGQFGTSRNFENSVKLFDVRTDKFINVLVRELGKPDKVGFSDGVVTVEEAEVETRNVG